MALLAGVAAARPFAVIAQQAMVPTIGYLSSNPPDIPVGEVAAFKEGLAAAGLAEGRDFVIEYRFAEGNYDRAIRIQRRTGEATSGCIAASGLPARW